MKVYMEYKYGVYIYSGVYCDTHGIFSIIRRLTLVHFPYIEYRYDSIYIRALKNGMCVVCRMDSSVSSHLSPAERRASTRILDHAGYIWYMIAYIQ